MIDVAEKPRKCSPVNTKHSEQFNVVEMKTTFIKVRISFAQLWPLL